MVTELIPGKSLENLLGPSHLVLIKQFLLFYIGANTFDEILNFIIPKSEESNINNEALSNFLKSTLNNETEKVKPV